MEQNNRSLHAPYSPKKIVDFIGSTDFFDAFSGVSNDVFSQISSICLQDNDIFSERYQLYKEHFSGNYSDENSFNDGVSQLMLYGITNIEGFSDISLNKLKNQLRYGDFLILEDLYLLKMEQLFQSKEIEVKAKLLIELSLITYGSVQMLGIVSMNSIQKEKIINAIHKMKVYFFRLFKELDAREAFGGKDGHQYRSYQDVKEVIKFNLEFAMVSYDSEIKFTGDDSKNTVAIVYEGKMNKIHKLAEKLENEEGEDYSVIKEDFLMKSSLLKYRLSLQYNNFQQAAHFNTKCKNDKKQFNLPELKDDHNSILCNLMILYSEIVECKFSFDTEGEDNDGEKSKNQIQIIMDHFLIQLEKNHKNIDVLFSIVETILYHSNYIDKDMLVSFQDRINQIQNENSRFTHGDLSVFNITAISHYEYKNALFKAQEGAKIDALTGVNNRKAYDEEIIKHVSNANRDMYKNTYFGYMVLDIDFFKNINDTYGHIAGDVVLSSLCKVISDNIRPGRDQLFRVGGEEFVILFEVGDEKDAYLFADKIRKIIERDVVEYIKTHNTSRRIEESLEGIENVTVSIGFTQVIKKPGVENTDDTIMNLCIQADKALYYSKNNGRNIVTQFTPDIDCDHSK